MLALLPAVLFIFLFSCQKELDDSRDTTAKGNLVKDFSGNCSLTVAAGNFIAARSFNDSNLISVTINITTPGTYTIYTDTVNGYSFKSAGTFTATGRQTVQLKGTGKPLAVGNDLLTVHFTTSTCQTTIGVRPAVPQATFTLSGAPNGCTNATLSGLFVKGTPVDSSSYVTITLNVSTAGAYSIATNTVNGYNFSGSGLLTATGMQSVRLYAMVAPINAGTDTFAVSGGGSTCSFTVPVIPPLDYFPLTANSFWVYDNLFNPLDSTIRTVTGTAAMSTGLYTVVKEQTTYSTRNFNFLKSGTDYLDYGAVAKLTTALTYKNAVMDNINFLKINVATGATWQSQEFTDTASFGQVISLRYNYVCDNANTTATVNGQTFTNVRKIVMYPEIKAQGNYWGSTSEFYFSWYAKDVGLIYEKKVNNNFTVYELAIRRWRVY